MKTRPKTAVLVGFLSALGLAGCRPALPVLSPPAEIKELEGYARLRITNHEQTAKSKFSFLVELPGHGRLQVFDPLGRTIYEIYVGGELAYFVLPAKKAYWQGTGAEIFEKFLGFELSLKEMTGVLSGQWKESQGEGLVFKEWTFGRDGQGRIVSGGREDFEFRVREFFPGSGVPRQVTFKSRQSEGRLNLLSIEFNRAVQSGLFRAAFLKDFSSLPWEEIEKILRNEG